MASLAVLAPNTLLRAGLAALLRAMGLDPVEEAASLEELKRGANGERRPEIVLVRLKELDAGPAAFMQGIKAWAPDAKVVFLAPSLDMPQLAACFAAGATGYLLEEISRDGLRHSLQLVSVGENVFPSELTSALSASVSKSSPMKTRDELRIVNVTEREIEILRGIANGESNTLIGKKLGISEADVSVHIRRILRKLRLPNRTKAALWGVARGLAAPFGGLNDPAKDAQGNGRNWT